jgi:hypothetical protein
MNSMERMDTINQRISERNKGSIPPVYFSPRPIPTKYVALPIIDQRAPQPIQPKIYDIEKNFLPSTNTPGYSHYVDTETNLMREKNYFPSSTSSLYTYTIAPKEYAQPHPLLFTRPATSTKPRAFPRQWINESTNIKLA